MVVPVEWAAHPQLSLSAAQLPKHWALLSTKGDVLCWDGFRGVSEKVGDRFSALPLWSKALTFWCVARYYIFKIFLCFRMKFSALL